MSAQDGGPAFPRQALWCEDKESRWEQEAGADGMSLRDYFAAKAMAATIERLGTIIRVDGTGTQQTLNLLIDTPGVTEEAGGEIRKAVAVLAYDYADQMLKAREVQS